MRTVIIGDIHGCDRALKALLTKVRPEAGKDRLVLLGDLFDRGNESREVFLTVKRLAEEFGDRFILILGNHDDYLTRERLSLREKWIWDRVGRQATVASFAKAGEKPETAVPWLKAHARLWWQDEEYQCVHAGLMLEEPEVNDRYTLVHDHGIVPENRYAGKLTVTGHIGLEKATWFAGDEETTEEPEEGVWHRLPERGILCIDTGCGKGGRLTAMTVKDGKYLLESVPENGVED